MTLGILGFLHIGLQDVLDILMTAALIYFIFRWIKGTSAMNIFIVVLAVLLIYVVVDAFDMKMMSALMKTLIDVGVLALIIIFQPEVRYFLIKVGSRYGLNSKFIQKLFGLQDSGVSSHTADEISDACRIMGADKTGALIVVTGKDTLQNIVDTGDVIDATVSRRLIRNIFFKNSPLHDGAMIITGDRISAARCTLPITSRDDIPPQLGMRHKAAIGISEDSDATVIVVSEETGSISVVRSGALRHIENINELKLILSKNSEEEKEDRAGMRSGTD